ncbi:hypothetical protein ACMFMG_011035 [Clarireedia jacksonii]
MAATSFHHLPFEIRQMVYILLIDKTSPRLITSPSSKRNVRPPAKGNAALFLVSRLVYADFAYLYYSKNQFVAGTGLENSATKGNIHGFRSFLSRVPRHHINYITRLQIVVYAENYHPYPTTVMAYDHFMYTTMQLSAFQKIAIMISEQFLGLQEIRLYFGYNSHDIEASRTNYTFAQGSPDPAEQRSIFKSITALLQHIKLRKVLLDIQGFLDHSPLPRYRPGYVIQRLIKNAAMQAIAEQDKWLGMGNGEAGEHSRWRLNEAASNEAVGFIVRD